MRSFILIGLIALTGCAHQKYNDNLKFEDIRCDIGHTDTSLEDEGVRTKGAIKSWSSGETLHSADLNANFTHIHTNMVGGHGARLVDADVSASASIAQSKIANLNHYAPRAWVMVTKANSSCAVTPAACTVTGTGPTVAGVSTGVYTVTLGYTATDTSYAVVVSPLVASGRAFCTVANPGTTSFTLACNSDAVTAADTGFSAVIFDNN